MKPTCLAYVTTPSKDVAEHIAHELLDENLIACANIFPKMTSIYRWQGQIQEEDEAVLILKTRQELIGKITARVKELHSYDCPCVVALPIADGNSDFLQWIVGQTAGPHSK